MSDVPRMDQDNRVIEAVWLPNGEGHTVGRGGVTRIVLYEEAGEMAMVSWFAVYQGDHLKARVPARAVEQVLYQDKEETIKEID